MFVFGSRATNRQFRRRVPASPSGSFPTDHLSYIITGPAMLKDSQTRAEDKLHYKVSYVKGILHEILAQHTLFCNVPRTTSSAI